MPITFIRQDELPADVISRDFVGEKYGGIGACVIFVDAPPGDGPRLHRHPYIELLIVVEGTATFATEPASARWAPARWRWSTRTSPTLSSTLAKARCARSTCT